jgi:PAS domain S-box-containing protein
MQPGESTITISLDIKKEIERMAAEEGISIDAFLVTLFSEYKDTCVHLENAQDELKALQERGLHAFSIGDAIHDGIYVIDPKGIIVEINQVFAEMAGISKEELVGKPASVLVEKKIFEQEISLAVLSSKKKRAASSTITRNNKKVLITSNPVLNNQGSLIEVLTVIRDITELNLLQEELELAAQKKKQYQGELEYFRRKEMNKIAMIGDSPNMLAVKELILNVSKADASVLISGETGSGKEVIAREIVKNSPRKDGPYIKINCAAIPETLLESELFGYEKGAFTGAQGKTKLGLFETANKGTILLDEIGDMPFSLQSKLLRVLQEKEITRLGGHKTISIDVRVIASTNGNLEEKIKEGTFREDLFYRLNVIPIKIPPLRTRTEDIFMLVKHFLSIHNKKYSKNKTVSVSAMNLLESYNWPGNVRELENLIERFVVVEPDEVISQHHVMKMIKVESKLAVEEHVTLEQALRAVEKRMITKALQKYKSTYKAAEVLGVSQPTVFRKAKQLGITKEDRNE